MNKSRRRLLENVVTTMRKLKSMEPNNHTLDVIKQAADDLELANDEEQDAYDSLPENLMWSTKADVMNDNLENLADAMVDMGFIVEAYETDCDNPYHNVEKEILSVIENCTEAIERV